MDEITLQSQFAKLVTKAGILQRGKFTLKSGRESSYFIDFGVVASPELLYGIGTFYAARILADVGIDSFDVLFGPAYKGIPLAICCSMALHREYGAIRPVAFNRKEPKGHGEGGSFLGANLARGTRVLIIDDVITDGGTKYETLDLLATTEAQVMGVVVGIDRSSELRGAEEFRRRTGLPLWSIMSMCELEDANKV